MQVSGTGFSDATIKDAPKQRSPAYQILLVFILSLNFGILFFDRNSINFLMPFIQPELGINFTQIGLLGSGLSLTWALSALSVGWVSDRFGSRKLLLIVSTIAFSLCSVVSGLAGSFLLLLGARMLMGVAEGGVMPISQAIVGRVVDPRYRGMAQGVTQNLGSNLIGTTLAAVLAVWLAKTYGWRHAFFMAAIPGLISSLILWFIIDEPKQNRQEIANDQPQSSFFAPLKNKNVLLCVLISILMVSYLVVCWAFMPTFLTQAKGLEPQTMGWVMAGLGISAAVCGFLVPGLSDFIGRRPTIIASCLVGIILPIGALFFEGSNLALAGIFVVGWAVVGCFPMFMATIPSESVPPWQVATAIGLSMGLGELVGGVLSPLASGMAADAFGIQAPLWIMMGFCIGAALLAFFLSETAPRIVGSKEGN